MRLVAMVISFLVVGHVRAFSPAIYGKFHNTLPLTVTVELVNRGGSVYHQMTITVGGTSNSPVTNGVARVFDWKGQPVATGATVKPSEKTLFDFERKTFYYEIRAGKVVAVAIPQGRRW